MKLDVLVSLTRLGVTRALHPRIAGSARRGVIAGLLLAVVASVSFAVPISKAEAVAALVDTGGLAAVGASGFYNYVFYHDSAVLAAAVGSLDSLTAHLGVDSLVAILNNPSAPEPQRIGAGVALGRMTDARARRALSRFLNSGDSSRVQVRVEQIAGVLGDSLSADMLFGALGSSVAVVRAAAMEALGTINRHAINWSTTTGPHDLSAAVRAAALVALKDESPIVRVQAIAALGRMPDAATVSLVEPFLADSNKNVVIQALVTLADFDDDSAVRALERAVQSPSPYLRYEAVYRAPWIFSRVHRMNRTLLVAAMGDADPVTRRTAARYLRGLGDTTLTLSVLRYLSNSDEALRLEALNILGRAPDARSVHALAGALQDSSSEIRTGAAWALGGIGGSRAESLLLRAMRDPTPRVRLWAAQGLGTQADTDAKEPLVALAADKDLDLVRVAAWALARIGDTAHAVAALERCIRSKLHPTAEQAALALAPLDGDGTRMLAVLLTDSSAAVRKSAATGLVASHDSLADRALREAANRQDLQVVAEVSHYYVKKDPVAYRQVLVDALWQYGTWRMAEVLMDAKDVRLASEGARWRAQKKEYGPTCGDADGFSRFDWEVDIHKWDPSRRLNALF